MKWNYISWGEQNIKYVNFLEICKYIGSAEGSHRPRDGHELFVCVCMYRGGNLEKKTRNQEKRKKTSSRPRKRPRKNDNGQEKKKVGNAKRKLKFNI